MTPVGRMVLNRNPDNFFAETEQVAFCTAHVVPGIDFSNDPLLAGRLHSYVDTQITRLAAQTSTIFRSTHRSHPFTTTSAMACTARPSPVAGSPTSRTPSVAVAPSRLVQPVLSLPATARR